MVQRRKSIVDVNTAGQQSFAAHIVSLYKESFFIDGGIGIGEFTLNKINEVAASLSSPEQEIDEKWVKKFIDLIGEPILRKKLSDILHKKLKPKEIKEDNAIKKYEKQKYLAFLKEQKHNLEREINRLENEND